MTTRTLSNKAASFVRGDSVKSSGAKFKASCFAVLLGLLVGMIPILAMGGNPFSAFVEMFTAPFNSLSLNKTIVMISVFVLMGTGIGISFKTGLFNIGASGQFLLAGTLTTMMGIQFGMTKGVAVPVMIVFSILIGAMAASIAGALKAFFNVHEVVSTILLNWIIFYLCKYFMTLPAYDNPSAADSFGPNKDSMLTTKTGSMDPILILLLVIAIVVGIALMFKYTNFGFKLKINGLSEGAATYSGISTKMNTIYSMSISGAFAGLAGYIYYSMMAKGKIPLLDQTLPSFGFEAITVTLLAFSSPMGSIPAGLLYAVLSIGTGPAALEANVSKQTMDLVLGLIVFFTALAPVLVNVKPIEFTRNKILVHNSKHLTEAKDKMNLKYEGEKSKYLEKISKAELRRTELEAKFASLSEKNKSNIEAIKNDQTLSSEQKKAEIERVTILFLNECISSNSITLNAIHAMWENEKKFIRNEYKHKRIDIFKRDVLIIDTNRKFKEIVENQNLNEVEELKVTMKQVLKSIKSDYKLEENAKLDSHFKTLATIQREKDLKISEIETERKQAIAGMEDKEAKAKLKNEFNEKISQVIEASKKQRETIALDWKEGK